MKLLCTICVRSGSKGLPNKNLRMISGKPLFVHTIIQAIESKVFNNIVVSTDSKKIQSLAIKNGVNSWFLRPKKLSNDNSSKVDAIRHALLMAEKKFLVNYDIICDLDVTSPLRRVSDINKAINQFKKSKSENLVSACISRKNPYFNMIEKIKNQYRLVKNPSKISFIRRQDAPGVYDMNASIYLWKRKSLLKKIKLINSRTSVYLMPQNRSIDIDNIHDFNYVKYLFKNN